MSVADHPLDNNNHLFSSPWLLSVLLCGVLIMAILSSIRHRGKVSFYHANDNSLVLNKKAEKSGVAQEKVSLAELCRQVTPSRYKLNPFLFNGHLQTAWTVMKHDNVPVYYKRRMFQSDNPMFSGQFALDFVTEPYKMPEDDDTLMDRAGKYTQETGLPERTSFFSEDELSALPSDDTKPMLVVLHGLSGGSHEIYVRHVLHPLIADGSWEAVVINSRGCAQTKISTGVLYNARATWDVRQAVKSLRKMFPNRPFLGIGFSLGACILTHYLGEEGDNCELKAAVLCANPWNLEICSLNLLRTWIGKEVYSKAMGSSMKELFEIHTEAIRKNPRVDVEAVSKITYLHEFDRSLQCPSWGYPTEGAYYRDASSVDPLLAIRVPFLAIQAEDDPIAHREGIPYLEFEKTPYGVLMCTSWGGHIGWFEYGGGRWFANPVVNFLNKMAKEIDLDSPGVVENPDKLPGRIVNKHDPASDPDTAPKPQFEPMRRRMNMKLHF